MRQKGTVLFFITFISLCTVMCKKEYLPPAIQGSNHFLAVDGLINTTPNSSSAFVLSRSRNLQDSVTNIPELNAAVTIVSESGSVYYLADTASNGIYVSDILNLDPNQKYQIAITTSDGNKYVSDMVAAKTAPPIDSLDWQLALDPVAGTDAVTIFVNSHDETNNTRYYRWTYVETWQHRSLFESNWTVEGTDIHPVREGQSVYNCWSTDSSHSILLGSSITLAQDVISQIPVAKFLKDDWKMDVAYSMLLKQYPLDQTSYKYWTTVQKNSQSLGGLFDLQPSQIRGNIQSVTNPGDPVLGYVSASSVQEKRIFIENGSLENWQSNPNGTCPIIVYPTDIWNLHYDYPDTTFTLYYFSGNNMLLTKKNCINCTYQGGNTIKPSFWP